MSYATAYTTSFNHTWTVSPTPMLDFRAGLVRTASWSGAQVDSRLHWLRPVQNSDHQS